MRDEALANPARNHPLVGTWNGDKEIVVHANGTETSSPMDSLATQVYSFAGDNTFVITLQAGSAFIQSVTGSWKIQGDSLHISGDVTGEFAFRYSLAGNTLTLAFPDSVGVEKVTKKDVFQRN